MPTDDAVVVREFEHSVTHWVPAVYPAPLLSIATVACLR